MQDDYSNAPVSIAERIADRERDAAKWKPRDLLIQMLREIDQGKFDPDQMIVMTRYTDENGERQLRYVVSTPSADNTLALIERTRYLILKGQYE